MTLATTILQTQDLDLMVREVSSLWLQAQRSFLAIGQYLLSAKAEIERRLMQDAGGLTEAERRLAFQSEFRTKILERVPFGRKVAHQLETVARAVFETRRFGVDELPSSYSVAYQLTTLSETEFAAAKSQGLIGQSVKREDLIALKRRLRSEAIETQAALRSKRDRLRSAIDKLQRELTDVEAQLGGFEGSRAA